MAGEFIKGRGYAHLVGVATVRYRDQSRHMNTRSPVGLPLVIGLLRMIVEKHNIEEFKSYAFGIWNGTTIIPCGSFVEVGR